MASDFTSIPTIDLALAKSLETETLFFSELRRALVQVGFFYLKNHSIPQSVKQEAVQHANAFFDLPLEKKLAIETARSKHFLGYNRMDSETTAATTDHNESLAFSSDQPAPGPQQPVYLNVHGPSPWPDEAAVPGFRQAIGNYLTEVGRLASEFSVFLEKALALEPQAIVQLLDDNPFSRLKVMKYPPPKEDRIEGSQQGVGAHKDGVFMTYLMQISDHSCLEVQNKSGVWIPVPPVPGTLVVNIGRMLEIMTHGVCTATTHRVTCTKEGYTDSDGAPMGPRISIPFFQHLNLNLMPESTFLDIPSEIADLVKDEKVTSEAEKFFTGISDNSIGDHIFTNMLLSYQEVGQRWYPELLSLALQKQSAANDKK